MIIKFKGRIKYTNYLNMYRVMNCNLLLLGSSFKKI